MSWPRGMRLGVSLLLTSTLVGLTPPAMSTVGVTCEEVMIPVAVAPGLPATESIYAELCLPNAPTTTVHFFITPSANNHFYWDPPFEPERYSFVRALNEAGSATLTIDPVGSGLSSHPPSALVTVDTYAYEAHQLVTRLRDGSIGGHRFERVITHGLSNGSLAAAVEASRYGDVDALILEGMSFPIHWSGAGSAVPMMRPAFLDPSFDDLGLDPGYVVPTEQFYRELMLSPKGYDPTVVNRELIDRTTTTIEYTAHVGLLVAPTVLGVPGLAPTNGVTVPVLLGLGAEDQMMCGTPPNGTDCSSAESVLQANARYYPSAPRLDAFVLPEAGHYIDWALNATEWFAHAIAWSNEEVGS